MFPSASVQSPRSYDLQNLTAVKLGTRLAAGAAVQLRLDLRTAQQDASARLTRSVGEIAASVPAEDITYGHDENDVRRVGAVMDGVADDTDALLTAVSIAGADIAGGIGNAVEIPQGTLLLAETVNVDNRVRLQGRSKRGTIIQATALWDTGVDGEYMLTAINGGVSMFDNPLVDLTVDCQDVVGLGGALSNAWQEGGGVRNCLIRRFTTYGVRFSEGDGGSATCIIEGSELFGSADGALAAVYCDSSISLVASTKLRMSNVTISSGDDSNQDLLPKGVHMVGASLHAQLVHVESCRTAIYLDGPGNHVLMTCCGSNAGSGVTNLVEIAATFTGTVVMIGCFRNGATNFLKDNRAGGFGTITGVDYPFLQINSLTLPAFQVGANWSGGVFDGTAGSPTADLAFNVASITKNGTGDYTITESRARGSALCAPWATTARTNTSVSISLVGATSYRIKLWESSTATAVDSNEIKFGNVRLA